MTRVQNQGKPCVECGRYRRHLPTCSHASSKREAEPLNAPGLVHARRDSDYEAEATR